MFLSPPPQISLAIIMAYYFQRKCYFVSPQRSQKIVSNFTSITSSFFHEFQHFNCSSPGFCPFVHWFHLFYLPYPIYLPYLIFVTCLSLNYIANFSFCISSFLEGMWAPGVCVPWPRAGGDAGLEGLAGPLKAWGPGQGSLLPGPGGAVCPDWWRMKIGHEGWQNNLI